MSIDRIGRSLASLVIIALLMAGAPAAHAGLGSLRALPVQDGGRIKPLDTAVRELLLAISDDETVKGQDPLRTFLSMTFEADKWKKEPLVALSFRPHREKLAVGPKTSHISYDDLVKNEAFGKMMQEIEQARQNSKELSDNQKEDSRLLNRAFLLDAVFTGRYVRLIPVPADPAASWRAISEVAGPEDPQYALAGLWAKVGEAYAKGDETSLDVTGQELVSKLAQVDAKNYATPSSIHLEVIYNTLRPFRSAAYLYMATAGFLLTGMAGPAMGLGLGIAMLVVCLGLMAAGISVPALGIAGAAAIASRILGASISYRAAQAAFATGWTLHTAGLIIRVVLSGRGPISNMFESMIYLSWGAVCYAAVFSLFHGLSDFGLTASVVGAVMNLAAEWSFDPFIAPLVPVLRSYWLWIHVQIIMLGYAGLTLAIALAHLRLAFNLAGPNYLDRARRLDTSVHRSIQLGGACLGTGIILGGIWADYSWGRYWGWDPKETWALITFLCYAALLHGRFGGWLGGPGVAAGTILGVFPLLMTYYGVNFLLVGLHSYAGAGTNAGATFLDKLLTVPLWLVCFCAVELIFLQIVDGLVLRDGRLVKGTLVIQAVLLVATWMKWPMWWAGLFVAQILIAAIAWSSYRPTKGAGDAGIVNHEPGLVG